MTRFLCNKLGGQLNADDLAFAKEVLRTKAIVGLVRKRNESYHRFKEYFGWKIKDSDPNKVECEERYLEWGWDTSHYTPVGKNSEEWKLLLKSNTFDLELYEFAEKLFEVQGALLHGEKVTIESSIESESSPGTTSSSTNLEEKSNDNEELLEESKKANDNEEPLEESKTTNDNREAPSEDSK